MLIRDIIREALKPSEYRKYMRAWNREKYDRAIFPNGEYRIYLPLQKSEATNQVKVPPEIAKVLADGGFTVTDYITGKATDKYGREVGIGKILNRFAPELKDTFDKDRQRAGSKAADDSLVVISRHPYDIAGMSTDRGWSSCMNLRGGKNKKFVMLNVSGGSLIAYLVDKDDPNITRPKARVLIDPYYNAADPKKNSGEVALGVNSTVYGTAPPEFLKTVVDWADGINSSKNLEGTYLLPDNRYGEVDSDKKWFGPVPSDSAGQIELLKKWNWAPDVFERIKNPSIEVQKLAVANNPKNIRVIPNPDSSIQMDFVKRYPDYISYLRYPSHEVQMYAIEKSPSNIAFINNPSEDVQMYVLEKYPEYFNKMREASDKVQIEAIKQDTSLFDFKFANNIASKKTLLFVLDNYPHLLTKLFKCPDDILRAIIKKEPSLLAGSWGKHILQSAPDQIKILAVNKDPSLIKNMPRSSPEVKQAAKDAAQKLNTTEK